jgi:hypothetical protein
VLLTVGVRGARCGDLAVFGFRPDKGAPPQCTVKYAPGPFTEDASGRPVTVAGTAFLEVRCEPARSYDLLTGQTTYVAPKDKHTKPVGTHHVVDLVATGDFEGVMSWVIGLDGQRPFTANATAAGALVISIF